MKCQCSLTKSMTHFNRLSFYLTWFRKSGRPKSDNSENSEIMSIKDGDERKNFVLASVANYFGTPVKDPAIENLRNNPQLISFLDDANATILATSVEKSQGNLQFIMGNATNVGKANDNVLVMFKSRPEIITPTNLHSTILVNSMLKSPVSTLYHSLHQIYTPLLLKDAKWSQEFDPKLQALITELGMFYFMEILIIFHTRWRLQHFVILRIFVVFFYSGEFCDFLLIL